MTDKEQQPLNANPDRQANDSLRGYRYQILHSVNAWLDLSDNEVLYLEGAEDFDIASDDVDTTVQVKVSKHNITLRSQEVTDAINNYWKLRADNPNRRVKFRFLTRSKIGTEQGNPFGTGKPGLQVWSRCSGDESTVTKISEFLQSEGKITDDVKDFLKNSSPQQIYEKLIEPITWETGSKEASFVEKSISEKLIHHGNRYPIPVPPPDAKKVVDHLLREALMVVTQSENRELTKSRFLEIFWEKTSQSVPIAYLQRLQALETQTKILDTASAEFLGGSTDISTQSYSPVLNPIPPPLPDAYPRTELLSSIQAKLQSEGIVVIHGGTDRGKTTIARLIARDASAPWLGRGFKKREPSQVLQQLHQLAIEIGDQSSPVNIILDDLNLQPQELQEYEEVLSVVIYGVIERGAKMLITSQHEPHDNLTRHLGVSRSIVVKILDFTLSEIEQFAEQLACPPSEVKPLASLIQAHTGGHPRLVHARLARLREENWKRPDTPDTFESIVQTPQEVLKEREDARQLLTGLPENHRKFLYRLSLMPMGFRKDYALNIAEIPESIPLAGDVFSQLVGPWIDQVTETYYTISPLLTKAGDQVWSGDKRTNLHAQIADAILKTRNLTIIETQAVLTHSIAGKNRDGFIAAIEALMTAPENYWKVLSQEFSWLIYVEPHIPEKLFPGDTFVNFRYRSLQHRIAIEVEPESAQKILESWDKETVPSEPHQSYLLNRLMLATQVLIYHPIPLPAKQIVSYLDEIVDITNSDIEIQEIYGNFIRQLEEHKTEESNFFGILFGFICARQPIYAPFLRNLIDALDELPSKIRTLLLTDFEDGSVNCQLLIDAVWLAEANLEHPDWTRCLQVFDKVIEKTLAWDYPYLAAASARGKAIIHGLYLHDPDTAHKVLQDIVTQVGALPAKEDGQILNIYERILTEWNPSSEQLDVMPPEVYHQGAICAAHLDDWESAATFFEAEAKTTQSIENTERHIGLYADAGFARFMAGNYLDSIKLLNLALQEFEKLPQDNTDVKYFTLKQRLASTIGWIAGYESGNYLSELVKPPIGFCSDSETNEEILTLPDSPIGDIWLDLAQIEYKFGNGATVLDRTLQIPDRNAYPALNFSLIHLQAQHDFRNKTLENLPQRIYQLASAYASIQKHSQTGRGVEAKGIYSISIVDLFNFASVEHIVVILVTALLVQLRTSTDVQDILVVWRTNSSELPIKENMICALDLIESMLSGNHSNALTVMEAQDAKCEKPLVAALKVIHNVKTSPENLFHAHTLITTSLIGSLWEDPVVPDLAELLSAQWLEKIKSGAMSQMNNIIIRQIEKACNDSGTGKKKIGQILLATYPAVSGSVSSEIFQQFQSWAESESAQKLDAKTAKNPIAQRLLQTMGKPPHLTHEDVEALRQSIEEGKIPIKFDSPFEPDGHNEQ